MSAGPARALTPRPAVPRTDRLDRTDRTDRTDRLEPTDRPLLRLVRRPARRSGRRAPRLPFVLVVVGLLAVGLVGLLLLSLERGQASIRLGAVQASQGPMADQVQALQREVENDRDPAVLAARAEVLGLHPATSPGEAAGYLDPTGRVLGPSRTGAPVPRAGARAVDGVVVARTSPGTQPSTQAGTQSATRPTKQPGKQPGTQPTTAKAVTR